MESIQDKLYSPKDVSEIVGVTPDLLRKWTDEFNVITEWTKPDQKGHRRYTKFNIEELIAIKKKIQEQNWSWDQVRSWRNGDIDVFADHEEKSHLEKMMSQVLENQSVQQQFYKAMFEKMSHMEGEILSLKQENQEMKDLINTRDVKLIENMRETMEKKQEEKPKKRSGFFGLFK